MIHHDTTALLAGDIVPLDYFDTELQAQEEEQVVCYQENTTDKVDIAVEVDGSDDWGYFVDTTSGETTSAESKPKHFRRLFQREMNQVWNTISQHPETFS